MNNKVFLSMSTVISILLFGSCEVEDEQPLVAVPHAIMAEMTEVVPIHPSSLAYFDYVICYRDNRGDEYNDTIQETDDGIVVEDWMMRGSLMNDYFIRSFSYNNLPVICNVIVRMIPKKDDDTVASFLFYTPKPYIYPNVYHSGSADGRAAPDRTMGGMESISVDSMSIGSFQSTYGDVFVSQCGILESEGGYETFFY